MNSGSVAGFTCFTLSDLQKEAAGKLRLSENFLMLFLFFPWKDPAGLMRFNVGLCKTDVKLSMSIHFKNILNCFKRRQYQFQFKKKDSPVDC